MTAQKAMIMAPAGGQEQLTAAVRCGAHCVYLGAKGFNARRNASNFGEIDLKQAVEYCHQRGVKVHVTVNTLILDSEKKALEQEADNIAAAGADAVIIQDMATLKLFAEKYPQIKRFASTQTAVHNVEGAKFLESCGFDSVVLARELSLWEMEKICNSISVPAEAFVHGAHCMSLSGGCYMSSMLGGRSGNRGLCAQPCRLDWKCGDAPYALSLKDMSLLSRVRDMEKAGVTLMKIEGRMKRPEYVAAAVTACKNALEGKPFDAETLKAVFSRSGFTNGYIEGKRTREMFGYRTKDDVTDASRVLQDLAQLYKNENPLVPVNMSFSLDENGGSLGVSDGENTVCAPLPKPEKAINRPLDRELAEKNLTKTGGTPYYIAKLETDIASGLALSAGALNAARRQALEKLDEIRGKAPDYVPQPFEWTKTAPHSPDATPALWARFYTPEQITGEGDLEKMLLPAEKITAELVAKYGDKLIAQLPYLLFPDDEEKVYAKLESLKRAGLKEVFTDNIYGINAARKLGFSAHGSFGLNVLNSEAVNFYENQGLSSLCVSFELQKEKIEALGGSIKRGAAVYGHLPLMHFRNCPQKAFVGCIKCGGNGALTDRKNTEFPIECCEKRSSTLLNSVPLDIADRMIGNIDYALLYFTGETPMNIRWIIERFKGGEKSPEPHTGGLYFRKLL